MATSSSTLDHPPVNRPPTCPLNSEFNPSHRTSPSHITCHSLPSHICANHFSSILLSSFFTSAFPSSSSCFSLRRVCRSSLAESSNRPAYGDWSLAFTFDEAYRHSAFFSFHSTWCKWYDLNMPLLLIARFLIRSQWVLSVWLGRQHLSTWWGWWIVTPCSVGQDADLTHPLAEANSCSFQVQPWQPSAFFLSLSHFPSTSPASRKLCGDDNMYSRLVMANEIAQYLCAGYCVLAFLLQIPK